MVQLHALQKGTKPTRLKLSLDPPEREVTAGERSRFAFRIENPDAAPRRVQLEVESPDVGWHAFLPLSDLTLPPGGALTQFLRVEPPAGAELGDRQSFAVTARPSGEKPVRLTVEAVVA